MALYTLFLMQDGERVEQVTRDCADDLDALDAGVVLCRDHVVEVYAETRLVARINKGDKPFDTKGTRPRLSV